MHPLPPGNTFRDALSRPRVRDSQEIRIAEVSVRLTRTYSRAGKVHKNKEIIKMYKIIK